jgi:hypothetical protein
MNILDEELNKFIKSNKEYIAAEKAGTKAFHVKRKLQQQILNLHRKGNYTKGSELELLLKEQNDLINSEHNKVMLLLKNESIRIKKVHSQNIITEHGRNKVIELLKRNTTVHGNKIRKMTDEQLCDLWYERWSQG